MVQTMAADPMVQTATGTTTTIILPESWAAQEAASSSSSSSSSSPPLVTITSSSLTPRQAGGGTKRRRVSASSSDSGVDDAGSRGKYPKLALTEEEQRMADKEGLVFPSHYPLTRYCRAVQSFVVREKVRNVSWTLKQILLLSVCCLSILTAKTNALVVLFSVSRLWQFSAKTTMSFVMKLYDL